MKHYIQTFSKLIRAFLLIVVLMSTTLVMSGCDNGSSTNQGSNSPTKQAENHDHYDIHDSPAASQGSNPPAKQADSHDRYDIHDNNHRPLCIFNFGRCG